MQYEAPKQEGRHNYCQRRVGVDAGFAPNSHFQLKTGKCRKDKEADQNRWQTFEGTLSERGVAERLTCTDYQHFAYFLDRSMFNGPQFSDSTYYTIMNTYVFQLYAFLSNVERFTIIRRRNTTLCSCCRLLIICADRPRQSDRPFLQTFALSVSAVVDGDASKLKGGNNKVNCVILCGLSKSCFHCHCWQLGV